jgi:hypothetical protein
VEFRSIAARFSKAQSFHSFIGGVLPIYAPGSFTGKTNMSELKKAATRLDKDEASANEGGWVILDGSPERDDTSLVPRMENGNLVAARAKTKRAAIGILKEKGIQGVTVALKKNWSFHDRVTDDWHQGEFWEMEVQQEKSRKKGKSSRKRKKAKPTGKSKRKTSNRKGAKVKRSARRVLRRSK